MKKVLIAFLLAVVPVVAFAQEPATQAAPAVQGAPVASSPVIALLVRLDEAVDTAKLTLARLRIEKWKTDRDMKEHLQKRVADSLAMNMQSALPQYAGAVRTNPNDLGAMFRLYRNLDALLDVYSDFAQAADAFAPREEAQSISKDLEAFSDVRRGLADQFETLIAGAQTELARLKAAQQQQAVQAAKPAEPKRIVVDEDKPAKKPVRKKKPAATTTKPS